MRNGLLDMSLIQVENGIVFKIGLEEMHTFASGKNRDTFVVFEA